MTAVVIGIDPHKRSNTALVLDAHENVLAKQRFTKTATATASSSISLNHGETGRGPSKARVGSASAWRNASRVTARRS